MAQRILWAVVTAALWLAGASTSAQTLIEWRKQPTDKAVIFVHGLAGDPDKSFTATGGKHWRDIIAADTKPLEQNETLGDFDLYAFDYATAFRPNVKITIDELAQQFATVLENSRIFHDYNHVWFVAHSLGGLVTKRMLIQLNGGAKAAFHNRVAGVFLLGVPSNGAPLANTAMENTITRYLALVLDEGGQNLQLLSDLRADRPDLINSFLRSSEKAWESYIGKLEQPPPSGTYPYGVWMPRVYCAYETEAEVGSLDLVVVSYLYAKTRCSSEAQPVTKKHTELPKIRGATDFVHQWLRGGLSEGLSIVRTKGPNELNYSSPKSVHYVMTELFDVYFRGRPEQRFYPVTRLRKTDEEPPYDMRSPPEWTKKVMIPAGRYAGSTWADVLVQMSDQQPCFKITFLDKTRRRFEVALNDQATCAQFK